MKSSITKLRHNVFPSKARVSLNTFKEFDAAYQELTGHDFAFQFQYRLFCALREGRFPSDIELATGLGKTTVVALWVLALACTIHQAAPIVPRRLAYVVDRRVVVDQASAFAEEIRARLEKAVLDPSNVLHEIACALRDAGCVSGVLETSTLRGQRALDTRWRDDPSRPAVLVGTVDMLGSRLLFSAFGRVGPWGRSLEAGLLGQDCLIVLDEAHLCAPFAATLAAIERNASPCAPFAVIRMGATMTAVRELLQRTPGLPVSKGRADERQTFYLSPDERNDVEIRKRLYALKSIVLIELDGSPGEQLADWAIERSVQEQGAAVAIVLNTVDEVRRCFSRLQSRMEKAGFTENTYDLVVVTGSMRGWDRDEEVVPSKDYGRFRSQRDRSATDRPAFLVGTSCIEVGADIDADHLGMEVCSAESLIQRLGRVNRMGVRTTPSLVAIVGTQDTDTPAARVFARLDALARGGNGRLSGAPADLPTRLIEMDDAVRLLDVRVPPPALTRAVLDDLAMTSNYPELGAHPDVGRWLHGSVEDASMYVELAWRAELDRITDHVSARRLVDAFPVSGRETARCPLYEAVTLLATIRDRVVAGADRAKHVRTGESEPMLAECCVLTLRYGRMTSDKIGSLPDDDAELRRWLRDAVIVLPARAGGYNKKGFLVDTKSTASVKDVAEKAQSSTRAQRCRLWVRSGVVSTGTEETDTKRAEATLDGDGDWEEQCSQAVIDLLGAGWQCVESVGNSQTGVIVARQTRNVVEDAEGDASSLGFREPVLLTRHLDDARKYAEALCARLHLPQSLRVAVIEAAAGHDLGKKSPCWQRAVGRMTGLPIAKSKGIAFNHSINREYRHEVGSVADLQGRLKLGPHVEDLCLHLTAAHHGHARPSFKCDAAGPLSTPALRQVIEASASRFARLQLRHGWWGLAWLEALVKAADVLASREEEELS